MKIGTIKTCCGFIRTAALAAFVCVFGLRYHNALLASREVAALESQYFQEIRIPIPHYYSEARQYPYVMPPKGESTDSDCSACTALKSSDSSHKQPHYHCESCAPHTGVRLSDLVSKEYSGIHRRLNAELCEHSNDTLGMRLHALMCSSLFGAPDKLELYTKPSEMRDQLVWEQFFNLVGGILGIWNFFGFIQNTLVQRVQKGTKKPTVSFREEARSEGIPITEFPGETQSNTNNNNNSWRNTLLRHRVQTPVGRA